jgi:hypothetical protein
MRFLVENYPYEVILPTFPEVSGGGAAGPSPSLVSSAMIPKRPRSGTAGGRAAGAEMVDDDFRLACLSPPRRRRAGACVKSVRPKVRLQWKLLKMNEKKIGVTKPRLLVEP